MTALFDLALVASLLALAVHIVTAQDDRNAVIAFVALGLMLGLGWVRLSAIDVALTEVAIGGGGTGLVLLGAEARLRKRGAKAELLGRTGKSIAALMCAVVTVALSLAILSFPSPAPTLAPTARAALDATGLGNPVTAVLLAYRALDTLLEKIVLVLALIGVWSLASDRNWGGVPELVVAPVPAPLSFLARALAPFGVIVGVYMFWVGADAPGGTFQAGTVLAAMWLLVMAAGILPTPETGQPMLRLFLVGGPALFLAIGLLGFATAGAFLAYPDGAAKPLIIAIEAALTLSVAVTLAMLVAAYARKVRRHDPQL